ncbi:hypothetical protein LWI28_010030 [Acer negundo]|uniref:Uncharacterized protein n=1 Tax=Acer negundo TaxID=4023 RepID=A0AAD5NIP9_ACENE|nr:hypothetical protein LWI28_010030 [Acer negundo]
MFMIIFLKGVLVTVVHPMGKDKITDPKCLRLKQADDVGTFLSYIFSIKLRGILGGLKSKSMVMMVDRRDLGWIEDEDEDEEEEEEEENEEIEEEEEEEEYDRSKRRRRRRRGDREEEEVLTASDK